MEEGWVSRPVSFRSNRSIHVGTDGLVIDATLESVREVAWSGSFYINVAGLQPMCTLSRHTDVQDAQMVLLSPVKVTLRYFITDLEGNVEFEETYVRQVVLPTTTDGYIDLDFSRTARRLLGASAGPIIVGAEILGVTDVCDLPLEITASQANMDVFWQRAPDYICTSCEPEPEPVPEETVRKAKVVKKPTTKPVRQIAKKMKNLRLK